MIGSNKEIISTQTRLPADIHEFWQEADKMDIAQNAFLNALLCQRKGELMEEWKDIEGFEGLYQISNKGRVRSLDHKTNGRRYSGKIRSTKVTAGYPVVRLSRGSEKVSQRVHRLVALAFIDNPNNLPEVNHLDGDKNNNCVENLEWCTSRENKIHAWVNGLTKKPPSEEPVAVIQMFNGVKIATYASMEIAEMLLDISAADICKCCRGKRRTAGGYGWKYKEVDNGN